MNPQATPSAQFEQLSPTAYRVEIVVPEENFRKKLDTVYADISKSASIPGFRPGKAPKNILNRHYGRENILKEATDGIIKDSFWPLLKERELTLIGNPRIDADDWKEGEEFRYTAVMEVMPKVPELKYDEIKVTLPEREITDDDIEGSLRRLRIQLGAVTEITDRPSQTDDFLLVDFEGEVPEVMVPTAEGDAPWKIAENDMEVEIGAGQGIEGLEESLIGVDLEEIKEFDLTMPADFPDRKIRGKTLKAKARIKGIKVVAQAEIDDEFIKERFGEQGITDMESLRAKILQELESTNNQADERSKNDQIEAFLSREFDFPLPEGLVRSEYADILDRSLKTVKDQGIDIDTLMKEDNEQGIRMRKRARYQAERLTSLNLIYKEIARREAIGVGDEEVANYIMMQAYRQRISESDLKLLIRDPQFMQATRNELSRLKISHFLISKVTVETISPEDFREAMESARDIAEDHEKGFLDRSEDPVLTSNEPYLPYPEEKESTPDDEEASSDETSSENGEEASSEETSSEDDKDDEESKPVESETSE